MMGEEKINRQNVEDIMPLSPIQMELFFHYLNDSEDNIYKEKLSLHIVGQVDIQIFKDAWKHVIDLNEMLRTIFRWESVKEPVQIVLKEIDTPISFYDLSMYEEDEKDTLLHKLLGEEDNKRIDLAREPFRIVLIQQSNEDYELLIYNHHILYDGWSNSVILEEFFTAYQQLSQHLQLSGIKKTRYREFVSLCGVRDKNIQKQYWTSFLNGFDTKTELPVEHDDIRKSDFVGEHVQVLDSIITDQINNYLSKHQITLATLMYTAWGILLQKYNNLSDVMFGTTVSGRNPELRNVSQMVGLFINTLPFRFRISANESIKDAVEYSKRLLNEREEYGTTPLSEIKTYSTLDKKAPLFNSIVVVENYPADKIISQKKNQLLRIDHYTARGSTNFDLTIRILNFENLKIEFCYKENVFSKNIIAQVCEHFINIISDCLEASDKKISEIKMLHNKDIGYLLSDLNQTNCAYEEQKTIGHLFEEQVIRTPEKIAVVFEDKRLTYRELNNKANQLARILIKRGVKRNDNVGLLIENSLHTVIGIIGIMKTGAAYVPMDPETPEKRQDYIIKDCNINIIATDQSLAIQHKFPCEVIDITDENLYREEISNLNEDVASRDLSYIIYTSGTTGKPKGAMIQQQSLVNYITWVIKTLQIGQSDKTVLLSSICFDLGYTAFFSSILSGAELHLLNKKEWLDSTKLLKYLHDEGITYLKLTPSLFGMLVNSLDFDSSSSGILSLAMRSIVLGGETIHVDDIIKFSQSYPKVEFINHYGPTEATVGCITKTIDLKDIASYKRRAVIGKPINNVRVYILDKQLNPVPIGVKGEIYIAGAGLSRGYVNQEVLTQQSFFNIPLQNGISERVYKTGDMGRYLQNGDIEFCTRVDHQVKIRGYRVELKEIESVLNGHDKISNAVVVIQNGKNGINNIVAYYVAKEALCEEDIKKYLQEYLPEYMIPNFFMKLDRIELTSNGKVNMKLLPEINRSMVQDSNAMLPRDEIERKVADIWKRVLGLEFIGMTEGFFDIGGNSILLTYVYTAIRKEFQCDLKLSDLFIFTTIAKQSNYIKTLNNVDTLVKSYLLKLPDFFFSNTGGVYRNEDYELVLPANIVMNLNKYRFNQMEYFDIFFSLFVNLLHEITEEKVIKLHAMIKDANSIVPMSFKLDSYNRMDELFQDIAMRRVTLKDTEALRFEELQGIQKEGHDCLILFADGKLLRANIDRTNIYDIVFSISDKNNEITINCSYNPLRIEQNGIEKLINAYLKSIVMFSKL